MKMTTRAKPMKHFKHERSEQMKSTLLKKASIFFVIATFLVQAFMVPTNSFAGWPPPGDMPGEDTGEALKKAFFYSVGIVAVVGIIMLAYKSAGGSKDKNEAEDDADSSPDYDSDTESSFNVKKDFQDNRLTNPVEQQKPGLGLVFDVTDGGGRIPFEESSFDLANVTVKVGLSYNF